MTTTIRIQTDTAPVQKADCRSNSTTLVKTASRPRMKCLLIVSSTEVNRENY